jgi:hypothetical protein
MVEGILKPGESVCILGLDGRIMNGYTIISIKLHIATLRDKDNIEILVNINRLLPSEAAGKASVASISALDDKYNAVCPFCRYIKCVESTDTSTVFECHGELELFWIGRTVNKAKKSKVVKMKQEPSVVDFEELKKIGELWTKSQVRFDDPNTDVRAHVLILLSDPPRKLCFNTYNGTLGKKGNTLPLDDFVKGESSTKISWYNIKDINAARKTLESNGFQLQ